MNCRPQLVAITGGSGSGKSWIADQLRQQLGKETGRLSLDSFYRDRAHLTAKQRERINFDDPRCIDWPLFEQTLQQWIKGSDVTVPQYDFGAHCRSPEWNSLTSKPVLLVDGLWLLRRVSVRRLFDFSIFLDCPESLRLQRRIRRDTLERGRTEQSVREQFFRTVIPMHDRFVAPQRARADIVLEGRLESHHVDPLVKRIRGLVEAQRTN